jgi:hypothetical protein
MDVSEELQGLIADMCGQYCPLLRVGYVVAVARLEFADQGDRTLDEVEAAVRATLDEAVFAITSFA